MFQDSGRDRHEDDYTPSMLGSSSSAVSFFSTQIKTTSYFRSLLTTLGPANDPRLSLALPIDSSPSSSSELCIDDTVSSAGGTLFLISKVFLTYASRPSASI